MLVLNAAMSKADAKAINDFLEKVKQEEKQRILNEIDKVEAQSHATKTPIYQEALLSKIREIVVQHS